MKNEAPKPPELDIEKIKAAIKQIEQIMEEHNLTLHVEHVIRIVPRR